MSVEDKDKIDFISTRKTSGEIILTISDHLDWEDPYVHLSMLQDKLNTYIHFIESGQIVNEYPQSNGENIVIEIVSKYHYNDLGSQFVIKAKSIMQSMGIGLRQTVLEI